MGPLDPRDHATTPRTSLKLTAPGLPLPDSHQLTAPTELPSADPLPSKPPTRMPLDPRYHATTPRPSLKLTAPGPALMDSQQQPALTELPSADPKPRRTPTP